MRLLDWFKVAVVASFMALATSASADEVKNPIFGSAEAKIQTSVEAADVVGKGYWADYYGYYGNLYSYYAYIYSYYGQSYDDYSSEASYYGSAYTYAYYAYIYNYYAYIYAGS